LLSKVARRAREAEAAATAASATGSNTPDADAAQNQTQNQNETQAPERPARKKKADEAAAARRAEKETHSRRVAQLKAGLAAIDGEAPDEPDVLVEKSNVLIVYVALWRLDRKKQRIH
jgi:hypothetical protein